MDGWLYCLVQVLRIRPTYIAKMSEATNSMVPSELRPALLALNESDLVSFDPFLIEVVRREALPTACPEDKPCQKIMELSPGSHFLGCEFADHFDTEDALEPNIFQLESMESLTQYIPLLALIGDDLLSSNVGTRLAAANEKFDVILCKRSIVALGMSCAHRRPKLLAYLSKSLNTLLSETGCAVFGVPAARGPLHDYLLRVTGPEGYCSSDTLQSILNSDFPNHTWTIIERTNSVSVKNDDFLKKDILRLFAWLANNGGEVGESSFSSASTTDIEEMNSLTEDLDIFIIKGPKLSTKS